MASIIINRTTPMDTLFAFLGGAQRATVEERAGHVILSPVIDPADYADDTEYLNAIPGMAESIIASMNAPASEFTPAPKPSFRV